MNPCLKGMTTIMSHTGQKTVRKIERGKLLLRVSRRGLMQVCLKKAGQRSQGHNTTFQFIVRLQKSMCSHDSSLERIFRNIPFLLSFDKRRRSSFQFYSLYTIGMGILSVIWDASNVLLCPIILGVFRTCSSGCCLNMFQEVWWALMFLSCLSGVKWDAELSLW